MLAILLMRERDCSTCTKTKQREWGCHADAPMPLKFDGEELRRCPRRPLLEHPEHYNTVFSRYKAYMKGYLPDAGSLDDQAYRYTRLMAVMDQAMDEGKAELERRAS